MNAKERLIAALHGKAVDRPPFSPFLAYVWEYFPRAVQEAGELAFHHAIGADPLWRGRASPVRAILPPGMEEKVIDSVRRREVHITTPVGSLRMAWGGSDEGGTSFLIEHPLKTEEDLKVQMWIEEHTRFERDPEDVRGHLTEGYGREGLTLGMLLPRGKSAYQCMVEHLMGTEALIYAQMDYPDTVRQLWEVMVQKDIEAVRISCTSEDLDYFITWEDSSTQNYSPSQYDEFIGSEIRQWCDLLGASGKHYIQHACGHVDALVTKMKDCGCLAVESLSPPPTGNISLKDARAKVGSDFGIIGGVEPTHLLQLEGKAFDDYIECVIEDGKGGPFVLANSDSCPPGVTVEKFKRIVEINRAQAPK